MAFAGGRLTRGGYIVRFIPALIGIIIGGSLHGSAGAAVFGIALFLTSAFCLVNATVRRFHDLDHSGHWAWMLLAPAWNAYVIWMLFLVPGAPGANRFGIDPLSAKRRNDRRLEVHYQALQAGTVPAGSKRTGPPPPFPRSARCSRH
jgi:uncharacterized membrane protein YhaH (DUF805 family)